MPYILTGSSIVMCPHGGRLLHSPAYVPEQLMIDGQLVFFNNDNYYINGCASGCERVEWSNYYPELIYYGDKYFLTNESRALCLGRHRVFIGYGLILFFQVRVDTESLKNTLAKSR
jgi:hypothetical protein